MSQDPLETFGEGCAGVGRWYCFGSHWAFESREELVRPEAELRPDVELRRESASADFGPRELELRVLSL